MSKIDEIIKSVCTNPLSVFVKDRCFPPAQPFNVATPHKLASDLYYMSKPSPFDDLHFTTARKVGEPSAETYARMCAELKALSAKYKILFVKNSPIQGDIADIFFGPVSLQPTSVGKMTLQILKSRSRKDG